jgi:hypothetical protein
MNLTIWKSKYKSSVYNYNLLSCSDSIGLIDVPAIEQAHAGCERGAAANKSLLKSKGRCVDEGTF